MYLQPHKELTPQGIFRCRVFTDRKWESLMNAATETAKQQKNGLNTSEMHI